MIRPLPNHRLEDGSIVIATVVYREIEPGEEALEEWIAITLQEFPPYYHLKMLVLGANEILEVRSLGQHYNINEIVELFCDWGGDI